MYARVHGDDARRMDTRLLVACRKISSYRAHGSRAARVHDVHARATTRLYHYAWCSTRISRPMSTQRAYFAPPFECVRASHVARETTRASTRAPRFGRKCLTFAREWVSIAHDDGGGASCTARGEMRSRVQTTERR